MNSLLKNQSLCPNATQFKMSANIFKFSRPLDNNTGHLIRKDRRATSALVRGRAYSHIRVLPDQFLLIKGQFWKKLVEQNTNIWIYTHSPPWVYTQVENLSTGCTKPVSGLDNHRRCNLVICRFAASGSNNLHQTLGINVLTINLHQAKPFNNWQLTCYR